MNVCKCCALLCCTGAASVVLKIQLLTPKVTFRSQAGRGNGDGAGGRPPWAAARAGRDLHAGGKKQCDVHYCILRSGFVPVMWFLPGSNMGSRTAKSRQHQLHC